MNEVKATPPHKRGAKLTVVGEEIDLKTANKIIKLMKEFIALSDKVQGEREEINARIKAAKADFREKVEAGHGQQPSEIENKLTSVEVAWQDWEEVNAERTEQNKEHREKLTDLKKRIKEAIANANQGDLFDE
jgi:prophage maintenance system killer protein